MSRNRHNITKHIFKCICMDSMITLPTYPLYHEITTRHNVKNKLNLLGAIISAAAFHQISNESPCFFFLTSCHLDTACSYISMVSAAKGTFAFLAYQPQQKIWNNPDRKLRWLRVGPTWNPSAPRWANMGPTCFAIWEEPVGANLNLAACDIISVVRANPYVKQNELLACNVWVCICVFIKTTNDIDG